jgi:hypothetical protein
MARLICQIINREDTAGPQWNLHDDSTDIGPEEERL